MDQLDTVPANVSRHIPSAPEGGRRLERPNGEFHDRDRCRLQFGEARAIRMEAGNMRLKTRAIKSQGDLSQIAFASAYREGTHHQKDGDRSKRIGSARRFRPGRAI